MDEGVKRHCKAYEVGFDTFEGDVEFNGATYKQFEVTLPQGSRITALPANPDTARGFSASVFLDEFAFHKDSHAIWKALFPVISAGHRLRITSTPNGKGNKFYELMTGKDEIWSRHTVDIHQAIADGLPRNAEELRIALADEDAWRQEFLLEWLDEATAWLPYELISACEDENAGKPELYEGGWCFLGNDIAAGGGDLWVLPVFEEVGDVLWCRELIELRRASFAEHDAVMADVFARYRVARLCMDQTGMGEKPVEDAKRLYGSSRVEGIHFTDRMLYGVFWGHAVGEALWRPDGNMIHLQDVRVRKARRFAWDTDRRLRLLTMAQQLGEILPERKFWTFETGADNDDEPYGIGLAHWLYWPVYFKKAGIKAWLTFMEKFAGPTVVAKYTPGAGEGDKAKALAAARAAAMDAAIAIPDGMLLELLESSRAMGGDLDRLPEFMDKAISKVVLSQAMAARW